MMNGTAARPFTARWFLFGEDKDTVETLSKSLHDAGITRSVGGVLGSLSSVGHKTVNHEVARVGADLADIDLAHILVAGWEKHAALMKAARSTLATPGTREVVDLATHCITSVHHPSVELLVDGKRVGSIDFKIYLEFVLKALVATVGNGNLTALHCGNCELTGSLACEGVKLAKRQGALDLNLVVRLDKGLPLLPRLGTAPPRQ